MGTSASVEELIRAARRGSYDSREAAVKGLGRRRTKRAIEALLQILADRKADWGLRATAADALGKIRSEEAVEPLIEALKDEDWEVRKRAAEALGIIGDKRAIEPLTEVLEDGIYSLRDDTYRRMGKALANLRGGKKKIGECPICGAKLELLAERLSCRFCGVRLRVEQNELVAQTSEKVSKSPAYRVSFRPPTPKITPLVTIPAPSPQWPMQCCLCLEPVTERDWYKLSATAYAGEEYQPASGGTTYHSFVLEIRVPYCKGCRHKVKKFLGRREEEAVSLRIGSERFDRGRLSILEGEFRITEIVLLFRNRLYATRFAQANSELIREHRPERP